MCKRSIGLNDDGMFDVVIEQATANKNAFTASGMKRVENLGFDWVFAGSMPCDRARVAPLVGCRFAGRSAPPSCDPVSAYRTLPGRDRCWRPTPAPDARTAVWLNRACHHLCVRQTETGLAFVRLSSDSRLGPCEFSQSAQTVRVYRSSSAGWSRGPSSTRSGPRHRRERRVGFRTKSSVGCLLRDESDPYLP